jgi:hypothetical protein
VASDSALKRERERKKRGRYKSVNLRNAETYLDKIGSDSRTVVRRSSMGSVLPRRTGRGMGMGSGQGFLGVNYTSSFPLFTESNPYRGDKYRDAREVWPADKWNGKERESEVRERAERREKEEMEERDYEIDRVRCMTKSMETELDSYSSCRTTGRRKSIGSSGGRITGGVFGVIDLDATISGSYSFKKGMSAKAEGDQCKLTPILIKPGRGFSNYASL